MPPVIAAVAAWAAAYAGVIAVATVVISAGAAIYGAAQARKAERAARDAVRDSMKDRMVTRIATEAPHRYIYGRAKVGADIVAMFTSGDKDQFRHLVCVHAAHECDAIEEVWVNNAIVDALDNNGDPTAGRFAVDPDNEVTEEIVTGPTFTLRFPPIPNSVWVFSGAGSKMQRVAITSISGQTVTVAQGGQLIVSYERYVLRRFNERIGDSTPKQKIPVVRVQRHLGNASDEADAYLRSVVGDKWPATSVLRGMCYTVITLDLNHTEFQGGLVPIHAVIRGRKLYDPRDGVTRWSQNPALVVMDYLTSPLCDVPMSDLPLAQFITAANACDEASPTGGARYTINGTVTSDQDQKGVLEAMAQAMAGGLVATTWDIYAGKYIAPVAALSQEDIVGSLSINPGVSDASVYNGVKGQYIGPENKFVQTDFTPYQNPTYREADGRDLYTNIDFPFTESLQRVTNLARVFTEDQRNGFTIKAEFSLKAWPLKVGQRITFTSKFLGQNAKVYRITDKSYAPNSAVQLTLKEDDASIWDYADATVLDSTPNTDLPDPWKVDAPASLSCTSGEATLLRQADGSTVPRILATWPAMAQASGVQVEIEWRAVSSPTWERTTVSADETQAYLSPITPGFFYVVRARCVNPSLNARSNAVATVYQVEVLKAAPTVYKWAVDKPPAPTGASAYTWSTGSFGAAPAGWSRTIPEPPTSGNVSLWEATVLVSDISASGTSAFQWASAAVTARGYNAGDVAAAKAAADAANAAVTAISSDNVLSKGEKSQVILEWTNIGNEFAAISAQATALGVPTADYAVKLQTLSDYLTGLSPAWNDTTKDTAIEASMYRTKFADYYAARTAIGSAISEKAATMATWGSIRNQPTDVSNLVKKGDFEDGQAGTWGGYVDARGAPGSPYAKQLTVRARDAYEENRFPVTPGEMLYLSAWLSTADTVYPMSFGLLVYDATGAVVDFARVCRRPAAQAGWAFIEGPLVVVPNGVAARPWLFQDGTDFTGVSFMRAAGLWVGRYAKGATVGAPVGSLVAGVPAADIAAGANAINSVLAATLSGTAGGGTYPNGSAGYGYLQVNISGGTAPYTVRWILTEDYTTGTAGVMRLSQKTGTSTSFSGSGTNATLSYDVTAIVTDAKQKSVAIGKSIIVNHGTPV